MINLQEKKKFRKFIKYAYFSMTKPKYENKESALKNRCFRSIIHYNYKGHNKLETIACVYWDVFLNKGYNGTPIDFFQHITQKYRNWNKGYSAIVPHKLLGFK
jgi:hypothetical protein